MTKAHNKITKTKIKLNRNIKNKTKKHVLLLKLKNKRNRTIYKKLIKTTKAHNKLK